MKYIDTLCIDIRRFYYHFDGVYFRRYNTLEAVFNPRADMGIDIFYNGLVLLEIDKYKKVHIYKNRISRYILPAINAFCENLRLSYRFEYRGGVWYYVPVPENDIEPAPEFTSALEYC